MTELTGGCLCGSVRFTRVSLAQSLRTLATVGFVSAA